MGACNCREGATDGELTTIGKHSQDQPHPRNNHSSESYKKHFLIYDLDIRPYLKEIWRLEEFNLKLKSAIEEIHQAIMESEDKNAIWKHVVEGVKSSRETSGQFIIEGCDRQSLEITSKWLDKYIANFLKNTDNKRVKLEDVCGEKIGLNSRDWVEKRLEEARRKSEDLTSHFGSVLNRSYQEAQQNSGSIGYLFDPLGKSAPYLFDGFGAKSLQRTLQKIEEMNRDYKKYEMPTENYLYDLCRGRVWLYARHNDPNIYWKDIRIVLSLLELIGSEVIRITNKLTTLGNVTVNFVYDSLITEFQIIFGSMENSLRGDKWSDGRYKALYELNHLFYEIERSSDCTDMKYVLEKWYSQDRMTMYAKIPTEGLIRQDVIEQYLISNGIKTRENYY